MPSSSKNAPQRAKKQVSPKNSKAQRAKGSFSIPPKKQKGKTTGKYKKSSGASPPQLTKSNSVINPGVKLTQTQEIDREKTFGVERTKRLEAVKSYHGVLISFFTLYGGLGAAKNYLKTIFVKGYSHGGINGDQYHTCARFVDDLETVIHISEKYAKEALIPELLASLNYFDAIGLPISQYYTNGTDGFGGSFWDEFPRYLTKEEYATPEIVLQKFFGQLNAIPWERFIRELWCSVNDQRYVLLDLECKRNPISLYDHAFKFVEALHLIKVRLSQIKLP